MSGLLIGTGVDESRITGLLDIRENPGSTWIMSGMPFRVAAVSH
jgi:hypothetical protein